MGVAREYKCSKPPHSSNTQSEVSARSWATFERRYLCCSMNSDSADLERSLEGGGGYGNKRIAGILCVPYTLAHIGAEVLNNVSQ